jgi:pSer/pThr/pTyr-binding forkhead associated (FHA) protein
MSFGAQQEGTAPALPDTAGGSANPISPDAPGLHLEVIAGNAAGFMILVEDELVIGRHAEGAGKLSDDSEISRQHARISREESGDYAIEDLGSSNGTFVNGLKIPSPRLLALGDSVELGATTLVVRSIFGSPPPLPTEPATADPGYAPTTFARAPAAEQSPPPDPAPQSTEAPVAPQSTEIPVQKRDARAAPQSTEVPAQEQKSQGADSPAPKQEGQSKDAPAPASAPPPSLTLELEVDFEAREARIGLGEDGERLRLVFQDGRWQTPPAGA